MHVQVKACSSSISQVFTGASLPTSVRAEISLALKMNKTGIVSHPFPTSKP